MDIDEEIIQNAAQFLRDGQEHYAADLLLSCEFESYKIVD